MPTFDDLASEITGPVGGQSGPTGPTPTQRTQRTTKQTQNRAGWQPAAAKQGNTEGFEDVMNLDKTPNVRDPEGKGRFNIDEHTWEDNNWRNNELSLHLPPADGDDDPCESNCAKKKREREKKCEILRKRVQNALYKAGCPSTVGIGPPANGTCTPCTSTVSSNVASSSSCAGGVCTTGQTANNNQSQTQQSSSATATPDLIISDVDANNDGLPDAVIPEEVLSSPANVRRFKQRLDDREKEMTRRTRWRLDNEKATDRRRSVQDTRRDANRADALNRARGTDGILSTQGTAMDVNSDDLSI